MMRTFIHPLAQEWAGILQRPALDTRDLEALVSDILQDIKRRGDEAVKEYTARFDKAQLDTLAVSQQEMIEAEAQLPASLKEAMRMALKNIDKFHAAQAPGHKVVETMPGVRCWLQYVPIEKVGLYIPGGTAPLFSTVLMLGSPARLAGCHEVVLCTPPNENGEIHPAILYAAELVGITKIYKCGGVQAIGAMAYGTESVPAVYKIFGPGNQYVTAAKQQVSRQGVSIDMPPGPSEVMVVADATAVPAYVAADLLSQAEHGTDSQVVLVTFDEAFIGQVLEEVEKQLTDLPRHAIARRGLEKSVAILVQTPEEALGIINAYAPEHLILSVNEADHFSEGVINAGSVFLGNYSPESVGDYASGTNHTLPTNGHARVFSGVSLDSFVKKITFQEINKIGLQNIGSIVERLATAESLVAHQRAVSIRLKDIQKM